MSGLTRQASILSLCGVALAAGCGGDARVELSAADALSAVAGQMAGTIEEYHTEVSRYDESRESEVVAAFVTRVRKDAADEQALASHVSSFEAALHKIHVDHDTEWTRRTAAMENVSVLREVSKGLQKLAIQSLSLEDEMKRYLQSWLAARQRTTATGSSTASGATKQ